MLENLNETLGATFLPTILWWGGIGVVALLIFPPTRPLLSYLVSQVFTPSGRGIIVVLWQWTVWAIKSLIGSHKAYFRHLLTPRSKLFPTLRDARRRGDGKADRD